jgi:hypothetical protein
MVSFNAISGLMKRDGTVERGKQNDNGAQG